MPYRPRTRQQQRPKQRAPTDPAKQAQKNVLYGRRWKEAAKRHKDEHPLCVQCLEQGIAEPAYAVDHIVPHKGDLTLFWDADNWQSLCERHHNAKSAGEK